LSDFESTLRHAVTQEFMDTCSTCLEDLNIPVRGRPDLMNTPILEDDDEDIEE